MLFFVNTFLPVATNKQHGGAGSRCGESVGNYRFLTFV